MRQVTFTIVGVSPLVQSRPMSEKAGDREDKDEFDERTWRQKLHADKKGVYIPPQAIKNCLAECAQFISMKVPGKGNATFTKHFAAGLLFTEPLYLDAQPEDAECLKLYVNADGRKGSGKRVWRRFPIFREWRAEATGVILDDIITDDIFELHLKRAGQFIGLGSFRPRNGNDKGRFDYENLRFETMEL